jgi:hypothetical protein
MPDSHTLMFEVGRSIRYHDRRIDFFEHLHTCTAGITVLLAGAVIVQTTIDNYQAPTWMVCLSVVAALLSVSDILIGFSKKADVHKNLKHQYCELLACVEEATTESALAKCNRKLRKIEAIETPVYHALNDLCYNEQMVALGYPPGHKNYVDVPFLVRLTANVFPYRNRAASQNAIPD